MSSVTRVAGTAGTFKYALALPAVAAPIMTIYGDAARTSVVYGPVALTAGASAYEWIAGFPATLDPGTYFLSFSRIFTVGQPASVDADDTLVLVGAGGTVGSGTSLCTSAIVTADQAQTITGDTSLTADDLDMALEDLIEWSRWDPCDHRSWWQGSSYPTRQLRRGIAWQATFRNQLAAAAADATAGRVVSSESIGEYSVSYDNTQVLAAPLGASSGVAIGARAAAAWNAGGFQNRTGYTSAHPHGYDDDNRIETY